MTQMIIDNQNIKFYDSETTRNWGGDEYYTVEGQQCENGDPVIYVGGFPTEWATSHTPDTGPIDCFNCRDHGSLRGVFLGYCANCADFVYHGERGLGFMGGGNENTDGNGESAFDTYLSGVSNIALSLVSSLDVVWTNINNEYDNPNLVVVTEDEDNNNMDVTVHGGPFNSDYEGGYNDF